MTDIHSHILWGMDDGAPAIEVSLEMLRMAAESGTTDIVATPHSNSQYEYIPALIDERIAILREKTGGSPRIHRGCDLHLSFDNVTDAIQHPDRYSINGLRYMLVEFSDFNISASMSSVFDQLLEAGLVPVITHPERNPIVRKDVKRLEGWVDQGCLVQVTALSVLGGFGKSAEASAREMLSKGLVHVIASDAHDPVHRHPKLDEAFEFIGREYGEEMAELLFRTNPGAIVRGDTVEEGRVTVGTAKRRKWWPFG